MYLRHQAYTLYYRHVFAFSMLLQCMLKSKHLVCGTEDVTQYNTMNWVTQYNTASESCCHDLTLNVCDGSMAVLKLSNVL